MTTFQKLNSLWPEIVKDEPKAALKIIENTWLKIEVSLPKLKLREIVISAREAVDDAHHLTTQGDQSYFDELISRDLAS